MDTTVIHKPSALHVKSVEDIMYLLKESEERWWSTSAKEAYLQWQKELNTLFSNYTIRKKYWRLL